MRGAHNQLKGVITAILYMQNIFEIEEIADLHRIGRNQLILHKSTETSKTNSLESRMQEIFSETLDLQSDLESLLGITRENLANIGKLNLYIEALRMQWNDIIANKSETVIYENNKEHSSFISSMRELQRIILNQLELFPYPTLEINTLVAIYNEEFRPIIQYLLELEQIFEKQERLHLEKQLKKSDIFQLTHSLSYCLRLLLTSTHRIPSNKQEPPLNESEIVAFSDHIQKIILQAESSQANTEAGAKELVQNIREAISMSIPFTQIISNKIVSIVSKEEKRVRLKNLIINIIVVFIILITLLYVYMLQRVMLEQVRAAHDEWNASEHENITRLQKQLKMARKFSKDIQNIMTAFIAPFKPPQDFLDYSLQNISYIQNSMQEIYSLIGNIEQVLSRTNLLSINGAIAAEKSGIAGKNFANIANSIKQLSAQTEEMVTKLKTQLHRQDQPLMESHQFVIDLKKELQLELKHLLVAEGKLEQLLAILSVDHS